MCDVSAAVIAGISVAGAASQYQGQATASKKQKAYQKGVQIQQTGDRLAAMEYQNQVWEQDIDYAGDMLSWAEEEFDRQAAGVERSQVAIEKNTLAATGQLLLRQVEEDIAVIAEGFNVRRTGAQARGERASRDRGVEGISVDAIINDVMRQEGDAVTVMAMNRSASRRALTRQIIEADAQGDQQLASLQLKTYGPSQQIRSPSPISSINPQAPVAQANIGQFATGVAGAAIQGFNNYNTWSGQTGQQTMSQMGNWLSREFTVTPASTPNTGS